MKSIFFIKDAKKGLADSNSVVLRYYLKSIKKYRVKGLGISCPKKDWDQDEQRIKGSGSHKRKYNQRLAFIIEEIEKIEEKRELNEKDLDVIVEAAKKNIEVKDVVDSLLTLENVMKVKIETSGNVEKSTIKNITSFLNKLIEFEKFRAKKLTLSEIQENKFKIQNEICNWVRKIEKNKDSTLRSFFNVINTCIFNFNKLNNTNYSTFNHDENKYKKEIKEIIYLTEDELTNLYKFVYSPTDKMIEMARPSERDMVCLKNFLFRCFSGMRISEMNNSNISRNSVIDQIERIAIDKKKETHRHSGFTYYAGKENKEVTVPYIGNHLFFIANDLNFQFPNFETDSEMINYQVREKDIVASVLDSIYGADIRKVKVTSGKRTTEFPLSKKITTHTARKTFAYLIYNHKKDIMYVRQCLGHAKLETTLSYLGIKYTNQEYENIMLDL